MSNTTFPVTDLRAENAPRRLQHAAAAQDRGSTQTLLCIQHYPPLTGTEAPGAPPRRRPTGRAELSLKP